MMRTRYGHAGKARILVADGDRAHAQTLSAILHTTGYEVATAFNGRDAVVKASDLMPDLLITEPYLGRISGIEAARLITAGFPDCRVLFLSKDVSNFEIVKSAPESLVYSFTSKPIEVPDLLNAIAYMLPGGSSTSRPRTGAGIRVELHPRRPWADAMAAQMGLHEGRTAAAAAG